MNVDISSHSNVEIIRFNTICYHHKTNYNKPFTIGNDGYKSWLKNGYWCRKFDKPARRLNDGKEEWYINGKKIK